MVILFNSDNECWCAPHPALVCYRLVDEGLRIEVEELVPELAELGNIFVPRWRLFIYILTKNLELKYRFAELADKDLGEKLRAFTPLEIVWSFFSEYWEYWGMPLIDCLC